MRNTSAWITVIFCLLGNGVSMAQHSHAWADSTLIALKNTLARDPLETLSLTDTLAAIYVRAEDRCALAEVSGIRSTSFSEAGELDSAMVCAHRVFELFPTECDSVVLLRGYVALSRLYHSLADDKRMDSIADVGLAIWRPQWGATALRNALLTNKAIAAARQGDLSSAEGSFRRILTHAIEENNVQDINDANTNLGAVKAMTGDLDSASFYFNAALTNARVNKKWGRMAIQFSNLASMEEKRDNRKAAIRLLDSAMVYAKRANDVQQQIRIHKGMSIDYYKLGMHDLAYEHANQRFSLNDSLLNGEKVRALTEMQEKYESVEKAKEILGLKAQKLEGELTNVKLKRKQNIYLFSGIGVLLAALALWSRLRFVQRSRLAIQKEKDISEGLLHNILPEEVAAELKQNGKVGSKRIDHVTVLFTDFKGFTAMAEVMTASDLVEDLNICFSEFDHIMEKYGIEKIKTIGDAYMAAGGLPLPDELHAEHVIRAAFEMRDFVEAGKARKIEKGLPYFEIRIGVHTGPVVAGIVGVKKFQYDIWGDTVNTASRMESSGEVGKVNISQTTYELVKNNPEFDFSSRGKIEAKGKGKMEMYFVDRVVPTA